MKNLENPRLREILAQLTKDQIRFVVALQEYPSKDAAAKAIGLKPATVYEWTELVDEAAKLMAVDAVNSALELRRKALTKAMAVKLAGLDSKNEVIRQKAASEIVEWELGKALQKLGGISEDGALKVVIEHVNSQNPNTDSTPSTTED